MKIETCFGIFTESCKKGNQVKDKHRSSRLQAGIVSFITLQFFLIMNVSAQVKRPLSPDQAIKIVRIRDVLMTPDGGKVFYSRTRLEWDKNKYEKTYYMIPSTGGTPQQFIGKEGGEATSWTAPTGVQGGARCSPSWIRRSYRARSRTAGGPSPGGCGAGATERIPTARSRLRTTGSARYGASGKKRSPRKRIGTRPTRRWPGCLTSGPKRSPSSATRA